VIDYRDLLWLLVFLSLLLVLQRQLHQEIQAIFLLLTRRADISIALFSLLFFPGVLLHELSHWLMAKVLGVRTGRFSLMPRPLADGRLQLGVVETAQTSVFGEALIGVAPLLAGGLFVAYAGWAHLGFSEIYPNITSPTWQAWLDALNIALHQPDFWLWFYLTFVVSSTMFPSSSDRRAWLPVLLFMGFLVILVFLAGAGPWFIEHLAPFLDVALQSVAFILGVSLVLHVIFFVPAFFLRWGISRVTGLKVA